METLTVSQVTTMSCGESRVMPFQGALCAFVSGKESIGTRVGKSTALRLWSNRDFIGSKWTR